MFFMWIIPLMLVGLAVYITSGNKFVRALVPVANRTCPHCRQAALSAWKNCPHCGQTL